MLLVAPVMAQEKAQAPAAPMVQKLFILKYADPNVVRGLVRSFGASAETNAEMRALAVSGTQTQVAAIEEAIAKLDTPAAAPKNIELTCYMVIGSESASEGGFGGPTPKELDSVVTQLRNAFAFKNYRLLDVLTVRARTGQRAETTSTGGTMENGPLSHQQIVTSFHLNSTSIGTDGSTVHIEGLRTDLRLPMAANNGFSYVNLNLNSDVDIKEGQKVVVGRLGVTNGQALFVVLVAKVVS
jgi:hypothetical protein